MSVLAGILEGLSWRDGCRAAAASRVFLEAGRSQRVLTFDGVDTESKASGLQQARFEPVHIVCLATLSTHGLLRVVSASVSDSYCSP